MGTRIRQGDTVVVTAGKDKGARGTVQRILADEGRVVVEGVNMIKRHQSAMRYREAGIIEREAPIDASNVMLIDPETDKPTRVRFEVRDGEKVRVAKSGAVIEG